MSKTKKWTPEEDDMFDKKNSIKEGSKRDKKLDKKRGVPDLPFKRGK